jgi:hypothetical protein
MKGLRGRAFEVREVCADFEELGYFPMNCQRKDIPDEGPGGGGGGSGIWGAMVVEWMQASDYALVTWHFK